VLIIDEFLNHLKEKRYSPKTIKQYEYLLHQYKNYLINSGITNVKEISEKLSTGFLNEAKSKNISDREYYLRTVRLKKYFQYLEENGFIFLSPLKDPVRLKYPKKSFPTLDRKIFERILERVKTDRPLCLKGKAIMELAYSSALRPREIYNLKITDIDFKKGHIFIEQSKNQKDRIVPVGKTALFWVKRYIHEVRPKYIKKNNHNFIFINHKTGEMLTVWGIRWAIQQSLRLSGFEPIKPYSLRSTAATALLLNGMGIGYISKMLGHTEIRTTQVYLRVQTLDLKKELQKKHPRNNLGGISDEI